MSAVLNESQETDVCDLESLKSFTLFDGLPEAVLALLQAQSVRRQYGEGQTIFSPGQYDGTEFLVVVSGALKASVADSETGAMLIEEINTGDTFGLEIAISDSCSEAFQLASVIASSDCVVLAIDAPEFKSLAASRPSLMRNVAICLARYLTVQRFRASPVSSAPEQRVYAALLESVTRDALSGEWRIERMPKHRELAEQADVDDAVAANAVAILIQEGVAKRDYPGLVVSDMQRFNQLAR